MLHRGLPRHQFTERKLHYLVVSVTLWGLTLVAWYIENPSYEIANVFFAAIISTLVALFGWLKASSREPFTYDSELLAGYRANRDRRSMMQRVKNKVDGYLDSSIIQIAAKDSGQENQIEISRYPWSFQLQRSRSRTPKESHSGADLLDIFDRVDNSLVITGDIGSGKSTTLWLLTRSLWDRANHTQDAPIPVLLDMQTWLNKKQPLIEWIVEQLLDKYSVPIRIGQAWVESDALALMVDGLDSIPKEHLGKCVRYIDDFREKHGLCHIAICCQTDIFKKLPLQFSGRIEIQPLSDDEIIGVLQTIFGTEYSKVHCAIQNDDELQKLARSPFSLSLICASHRYEDSIDGFSNLNTNELKHAFLRAYLTDRLDKWLGENKKRASEGLNWLSFLASNLVKHNENTFLLENIQTTWLPTSGPKRLYAVISRMVLSVMVLMGVRLVFGLAVAQLGLDPAAGINIGAIVRFLVGIILGGLPWALFLGLAFGLQASESKIDGEIIEPVEAYKWSLEGAMNGWKSISSISLGIRGFRWGLPLGLGLGAIVGLIKGDILWGVILGLIIGPVIGIGGGLVARRNLGILRGISSGLTIIPFEYKVKPNEGIRRSVKNALLFSILAIAFTSGTLLIGRLATLWVIYGVKGGIIISLLRSIRDGLVIGSFVWLKYGGLAAIYHYAIRFSLAFYRLTPWNYVKLLDSAVHNGILKQIGGGYTFMHPELLNLLASNQVDESVFPLTPS